MTYLAITIDTEEDNWGQFDRPDYGTKNIEKLPRLQELFDKYGARPTYLLTYRVANDDGAVRTLKGFLEAGVCEIGTHPHPWNTPPYRETINDRNSFLCNLPGELQYEKIRSVHDSIRGNFGIDPVSFRAGRWGFDESVARNILKLGYKVDSSIMPFFDWSANSGPDFSTASTVPYRLSVGDGDVDFLRGDLLEIPPSIGFNRENFKLCNKIFKKVTENPLRLFKIGGIMSKLNLLKRITLSPEDTECRDMIHLAKILQKSGHKILNMFFHSPSLVGGLTPFVKTKGDEEGILRKTEDFLRFTAASGIRSIKLSESVDIFRGNRDVFCSR